MSFMLTTEQVRRQTKTVTRRVGWTRAMPGDVVQPIVKGQGLRAGEKVDPIGPPIRFVSVTRERLKDGVTPEECSKEGFPFLTPDAFVSMFCRTHQCGRETLVTRIEFAYQGPTEEDSDGQD